MTISAAGFGRQIEWEDGEAPPGHNLSFKRSVEAVSTGLFIRLISPKWLFEWGPSKKIRDARDGFAEFRVCLLPTRLPVGTFLPRIDPTCPVVFGRDDQRSKVL